MPWNPSWELERRTSGTPVLYHILAAFSWQRKLAFTAFAAVFTSFLLFGLVFSDRYEARMEIMVDQAQLRRAEPVLTGVPNAQPIVDQAGTIGDQTLNSEIALIESRSVLREVVEKCGLNNRTGVWGGFLQKLWTAAGTLHATWGLRALADVLPFLTPPTRQETTAKAVNRLSDKLNVEVLKMSTIISVTYHSKHRQLAAQVLNTLGEVYLRHHALAHYPPGELEFFERQTSEARIAMQNAEAKLAAFTKDSGVASGQVQTNQALQRLSDEMASLAMAQASIAATEQRIASLHAQAMKIPRRQITQLKTSDSDILLQNLKQSLLNLETKRTALLTQYQQGYPLVTEVNRQIAQTRAALADAKKLRSQQRTTDENPDYEMVQEDLTRSYADLAALKAKASKLDGQIAAQGNTVKGLQENSIRQQDLMRVAQADQDNYVMLLHKKQEAKIAEALDQQGVFNVSIVQPALIPELPIHPAIWYVLYGALLSLLCAFATAIGAERLDPTVRTMDELESMLDAPVLAVLAFPVQPPTRIVNG